jgi:hypothetical protein
LYRESIYLDIPEAVTVWRLIQLKHHSHRQRYDRHISVHDIRGSSNLMHLPVLVCYHLKRHQQPPAHKAYEHVLCPHLEGIGLVQQSGRYAMYSDFQC